MISVPEQMLGLIAQGVLSKYGVSIFGKGEYNRYVSNLIKLEKLLLLDKEKYSLSTIEKVRKTIYGFMEEHLDKHYETYEEVSNVLNNLPIETKRNIMFLIFSYITEEHEDNGYSIDLLNEYEDLMFNILQNNLSLNVNKSDSEFDFKELIISLEVHTSVATDFINILFANILNTTYFPVVESNAGWKYNSEALNDCGLYSISYITEFIILGKLSNIDYNSDKPIYQSELDELFKYNTTGHILGFINEPGLSYPRQVTIYKLYNKDSMYIIK